MKYIVLIWYQQNLPHTMSHKLSLYGIKKLSSYGIKKLSSYGILYIILILYQQYSCHIVFSKFWVLLNCHHIVSTNLSLYQQNCPILCYHNCPHWCYISKITSCIVGPLTYSYCYTLSYLSIIALIE